MGCKDIRLSVLAAVMCKGLINCHMNYSRHVWGVSWTIVSATFEVQRTVCVDFVPYDFWSYGPIGSTSHILYDQYVYGLLDLRTPRAQGPGRDAGTLRLDLDNQGPWNHAACALTGTTGTLLPVHCTHIIQPMLCALRCGNSIALCCHAQLGSSRCDGPAVCRTSLFLSLLPSPVATGYYTGSSSSSCTCLDCPI